MPLSEIPPPLGTSPDAPAGEEPPWVRVAPPGPMSRSWAGRLVRVEAPMVFEAPEPAAQAEIPIVYASALGSNVVDVDGNRFVDLAAGFGAILLGHGNPRIARTLEMQAERAWMALGDVYPADAKVGMLERLVSLYPAPGAKALLCQSGSDAITAAIKTALLATGRAGVVAFEGGYHGLGYAALGACGYRESFRRPFTPQLNAHIVFAPYPRIPALLALSLEQVEQELSSGKVGAVLVEPIQGRGGCVVPPDAFLPELLKLCHAHGALLIADEIWTGLGRSGALLACSRVGVVPDIVCLGKGLGGGLPISACMAPASIMDAWAQTPGVVHTSTFQGNPLACATSVATIDLVRSRKLDERARDVGAAFMDKLRVATEAITQVVEVRGAGLMIGIVLNSAAAASTLRRNLLQEGYICLTGGSDGSVLTLTPPLTIAERLLDDLVDVLAGLARELPAE